MQPGARVFVMPVAEQYTEFEGGGEVVSAEIGRQLQDGGWQPVTMEQSKYTKVWSSIVRRIGGMYSPQTGKIDRLKFKFAAMELVRSVSDASTYDAFLFPSLVIRDAELKGKRATWDGVSRAKVTRGSTAPMSWSGTTKGLSLEIIALDAESNWLFTSYGGLALPFYSDLRDNPKNEVRDDIFDRPYDIQSGVTVALYPILDREMKNRSQ